MITASGIMAGKLASLNSNGRAKKARIMRWGWLELNPHRPIQKTGLRFRLNKLGIMSQKAAWRHLPSALLQALLIKFITRQ